MGNRVKEEEKIERTIRTLLKLPENRRCINCNSLGPQYVCTTFLTFVCTSCSGVHREFTHRVKSVSMAKFSAEEVTALQAAGNERARQIYLKAWDAQRHSYPDSSNLHKLRNFIKHVYVDRKYAGEKSVNELPRLRLTDKDPSQERRKVPPYSGGLYSMQGEVSNSGGKRDHRSSIYFYDERNSPRYARENTRYGGFKRSLTRIEVVDDRIKDDRHGNRGVTSGELKLGNHLSESQGNLEKSSSSAEASKGKGKEMPCKNKPPLTVVEEVKENKRTDASGSNQDQNLVCVDPIPMETKRDNLESLIDLSISSEPSDATAQQMPSSNDNGNWDAFDQTAKNNVSAAPSSNTLEALLFELSVSSAEADTGPEDGSKKSLIMGPMAPPISTEASVAGSTENRPSQPCNASPTQLTSNKGGTGDTAPKIINGQQPPSMQQKRTCDFPFPHTGLNSQQMTVAAVPNFEPWASPSESNAQGFLSVSSEKVAGADSKQDEDSITGVGSQSSSSEVKFCGRKELPADLFAVNYPPFPTTNPVGWQMGAQRVMDYNSQYYPNTVTTTEVVNTARRSNPFDFDDGKSRPYIQSNLYFMPASTGLVNTSSYQPQYSGTYMEQQAYGNTSSLRSQGVDVNGPKRPPFESFNISQQQPNSVYHQTPFGNNPFG